MGDKGADLPFVGFVAQQALDASARREINRHLYGEGFTGASPQGRQLPRNE